MLFDFLHIYCYTECQFNIIITNFLYFILQKLIWNIKSRRFTYI